VLANLQHSNDIIKKYTAGFIPDVDYKVLLYKSGNTPAVQEGYTVSLNIRSISRRTYFYFKYMLDQLNAPNNLFDPISTQLMGNIHCTSDSSKVALGYFEAASITHKYAFLRWFNGGTQLKNRNLNYYPSWEPEQEIGTKPVRWND
jgi:hypothetical protein